MSLALGGGFFTTGTTWEAQGQKLVCINKLVLLNFNIFFAAKDGEALYSQQKQDQELTVSQVWTPYCKIQT